MKAKPEEMSLDRIAFAHKKIADVYSQMTPTIEILSGSFGQINMPSYETPNLVQIIGAISPPLTSWDMIRPSIDQHTAALDAIGANISRILERHHVNNLLRISPALEAITNSINTSLSKACAPLEINPVHEVFSDFERAKKFIDVNWIPHPALPVRELTDDETEETTLTRAIDSYVENNAARIYETLKQRLSKYSLDNYAMKFALDAIEAHRSGLYTLIVPAIFAEIERNVRLALSPKGGTGKGLIDRFVSRIEDLVIWDDPSFILETLKLFQKHLYESVRSKQTPLPSNKLPNPHSAVHGWAEYAGRDALNALFILDFVFSACAVIAATSERFQEVSDA